MHVFSITEKLTRRGNQAQRLAFAGGYTGLCSGSSVTAHILQRLIYMHCPSVSQIILFTVLGISVVTDVQSGKIKNWLTLPAIALGPIVHLIEGGRGAALSSLEGAGVMIAVSVALVMLRIFGGGDIKLLVAVGSLAGMGLVMDSLLYSGVAGGVLAIIMLTQRRKTAVVTKQLALSAWLHISHGVDIRDGGGSGIKMPYSIAIAAGTVAAVFLPL